MLMNHKNMVKEVHVNESQKQNPKRCVLFQSAKDVTKKP